MCSLTNCLLRSKSLSSLMNLLPFQQTKSCLSRHIYSINLLSSTYRAKTLSSFLKTLTFSRLLPGLTKCGIGTTLGSTIMLQRVKSDWFWMSKVCLPGFRKTGKIKTSSQGYPSLGLIFSITLSAKSALIRFGCWYLQWPITMFRNCLLFSNS